MDEIDDNIKAVTAEDYASRPWTRKYPYRWEVLVSYVALGLGSTLGVGALWLTADRSDDNVVQIVCGLRGFVDGLLDAGSEREAVLARFDESLPDVACPTP